MTFIPVKIVACKAKPDYILWIRFDDGLEGEVDLSNLVGHGVFKAWESVPFWESVRVDSESETVAWGEEIDLDPFVLKQEILSSKNDSNNESPEL
jgi:hypothetical protein